MNALLLLLTLSIDGTVVNRTTGKPVAGVSVSAVRPSERGMQTLGTAQTDASGQFKIDAPEGGGMTLLQANFGGVNYNKMLTPGSAATGVEVEVFDANPNSKGVSVVQHMILIESLPGQLRVRESVILNNTGKTTYIDPNGTYRFFLPPMAQGKVTVNATSGAMGMPLNRTAEATKTPNVYAIDFPMKPGETRLDLGWSGPFSAPGELKTNILHKDGPDAVCSAEGHHAQGRQPDADG